jgi:subtilisin family serine protease
VKENKMKRNILIVFLVISLLNLGFILDNKSTLNKLKYPDEEVLPNVIIIKMKENPDKRLYKNDPQANEFNNLLTKYKTYSFEKIFREKKELLKTNSNTIDLSKYYFIKYSDNIDPFEVAKIFSQSSLVEYAEPQFIRKTNYTPNDYYFTQGVQWAIKKIQAEQAWDITKGSSSVIIGIVDTGIDWNHPDLANNIWINTKEIPNNGKDDDNNGFIDDVRGWDFGGMGNGDTPTPDNDPNEDRSDHGTHVAGIASAVTNNNIGVAGVGFNCKLMAVKVSQDSRRDNNGQSLVIFGYQGIVYAADNGAQIINCSWGGGGYSKFEDEIIQYVTQKGALVVAAAGNNGTFRESYYPAAYNHVLAVAATDANDLKASFSNYGYYVDVCAPGTQIISTWRGNNYVYLEGTSMSSPHVAGVAALVKSVFPNYTPDQVAEKVRVSCDKIDDKNTLYAGKLGFGRINAYKAVTISSPSIRLVSNVIDDKTYGNGNNVLEKGEKILVKSIFKNYLDPVQNLSITLSSNSPYIKINKGSLVISSINTLEEINNDNNNFEFEIDKNTPLNTSVQFTFTYSSGNYNDVEIFSIIINPSFANTTVNNIEMTITSEGNIGFNDFPDNKQGIGFIYNKNNENLLFEGALMIAASATQISDCARNEANSQKNNFFKTITPIHFEYGKVSDEDGETIFNDDNSPTKLGIKTTLNSYSYKSEPYNNFIILKYTFENTNQTGSIKFYPGIFFDWDLGVDGGDNIVRFDPKYSLAYVRALGGNPATYVGVSLLTNTEKVCFWPILNPGDTFWGIYDGFTKAEKFESLSSGIKRDSAGPGDISFVIGSGETILQPGSNTTVFYAMVAGKNLDELRNSLQYAKQKLGVLSNNQYISLPDKYELYTNYPNPFNPTTNLKYTLKEKGSIKIEIFDIKGSLIKEIVKKDLPAGVGYLSINMQGNSTGVYFYRFTALNSKSEIVFMKSSKFVLLK